jgi:hypothetical protein
MTRDVAAGGVEVASNIKTRDRDVTRYLNDRFAASV